MAVITHLKGSKEKLSESFSADEFSCPCSHCTVTFVDSDLVSLLQVLRNHLGVPLKITSGYRCENHQKELTEQGYETAKNSQHALGKAADLHTGLHTGEELEKVARDCGFKAVGVGKHFIHLDLRSEKVRRWTYSY